MRGNQANKLPQRHFTHRHNLRPSTTSHEFFCKGCSMVKSAGLRYKCNKMCKWDLCMACFESPDILTTHIHSNHRLNLVWTKDIPEYLVKRGPCGVCEKQIESRLFYNCPFCQMSPDVSAGKSHGFFLHSECSTFPSCVVHDIDKYHPLTWQKAPSQKWCTICRNLCPTWHYRCQPCQIDVHFECAATGSNYPKSSSSAGTGGGGRSGWKKVLRSVAEPLAAAAITFIFS